MKKIVSVLLALALTLTLVGSAVAEDKVNLTAFQYTLENQSTDFNNLWFFQQIEEKTNTHVDFTMVKDGDFQTQLNLMFISGKYMDMILRGSTDIEDYGVNQGLLMPLDEYITEDIMPNYVSRLNLNNAGDSIPASDGHSYYIGYLIAQNVNHNGTWYINTTLLDQLGLEVPTTIDEYTNVLRKFKEAGIKYPLSTSTFGYGPETIWNEFASFGVPENYAFYHITDDDKVEFTGTMPGWRACVEWLHMLYEEGLLDPECLTQDSNLWANKVNAGEVASFPYLRLINTALTPDVYKDFKSILPPADPTYGAAVSAILEVPDQGAILTSTNANPVASLKWIDAQLETETMMVAANGKVGEQIQLNDEGKYEVINVPENNGLYSLRACHDGSVLRARRILHPDLSDGAAPRRTLPRLRNVRCCGRSGAQELPVRLQAEQDGQRGRCRSREHLHRAEEVHGRIRDRLHQERRDRRKLQHLRGNRQGHRRGTLHRTVPERLRRLSGEVSL